jgi:glyoxylase-like metal-dependent hydrolase (beta-lactamase superfamily II)
MKRLLLAVMLITLAAGLLLPAAALADAGYPPWMSADTWPRPEWSGYPVVDTSKSADPGLAWFEIHKLRPNVYAIYEPGNWQEVMSYLFIGRHKAMLYDTGMNIGDIKHATDFLTNKPVFVVNSHCHPDHTGCNFEYDSIWALKDREARYWQRGWTNEEVSFIVDPSSMWPEWKTPARFDPATYCIPPYTITHWLRDGDVIDLGNMEFEVINTPGHSTDGTCLLDRAHRLLLVGDVWYNGQLGVNDLKAYTRTAEKLGRLACRVDYILPSHNCTMISSLWLLKMRDAFRGINDGTATDYVDYPDDGVRFYDFGYFSAWVPLDQIPK